MRESECRTRHYRDDYPEQDPLRDISVPAHELNEIVEPGQTLMSKVELSEQIFVHMSRLFGHDGETVGFQSLQNVL